MLKKQTFSDRLRFIFVLGIEGSGHHFWSSMFDLCSKNTEYGVPQCYNDRYLSSLLYRNGSNPHGLLLDDPAYETMVSQRLNQYSNIEYDSPQIVPINTLYENDPYKMGMMSFPTWGSFLLNLTKLVDVFNRNNVDLRIIHMKRDITTCVKSTLRRSFYNTDRDAMDNLEIASRFIDTQKSNLDPQFFFDLDFEDLYSLKLCSNSQEIELFERLHQFIQPLLLRSTLHKMFSEFKKKVKRKPSTKHVKRYTNGEHNRLLHLVTQFTQYFDAIHILCYNNTCPDTRLFSSNVTIFDGYDIDSRYSAIIDGYSLQNKYTTHTIKALITHLHSIRYALHKSYDSVLVVEVDAEVSNSIHMIPSILKQRWELIRMSGKYENFLNGGNKCLSLCKCNETFENVCFAFAQREWNATNLERFTIPKGKTPCLVQDSSLYAVHKRVFSKFDVLLALFERYARLNLPFPRNVMTIDSLLSTVWDSFRLVPPIAHQKGKNYDALASKYIQTCTRFQRKSPYYVYVDPKIKRLSMMIRNTPFLPRLNIYGSKLRFVHNENVPHDLKVCLLIRTKTNDFGKNLSYHCSNELPKLTIYSSEDCMHTSEMYDADLIQYNSNYSLGKYQSAWFLGARHDFDFVHRNEIILEKRKFLFNFVSSLSTNPIRRKWLIWAKSTVGCKFIYSVRKWTSARKYPAVPMTHIDRSSYSCSYDLLTHSRTLDVNQWREVLLNSDFTLSPPGHNPECYRIFEAAEAGSIPVFVRSAMETSACPRSLDYMVNMPKIVLDDIRELRKLTSYSANQIKQMRLDLRDWYDSFMKNVSINVDNAVERILKRSR